MAAAALVLTAGWGFGQEDGQTEVPPDARKTLVEGRTEGALRLVSGEVPAPAQRLAGRIDRRKEAIEVGTETLLAAPDAASAASAPAVASPPASAPNGGRVASSDANPKVAPGLVRWHADLAAAQAAARVSGKPVLVFQLLGNLDDEFC